MRSTIRPILTVSCARAGAVSAKNTAAKNVLIRLAPGIGALGGGDALVVAVGDAPLIGASSRPLPVLGAADLVVVVELFDLRGVLDHAAVRADEIAEDIVAWTVTSRSPDRREPGARAAKGNAADRRLALLETDEVGQARGAAQPCIPHRRESPDLLEEFRRLGDIGDSKFNALQFHSPRILSALPCMIFSITTSL